jgi:flagellar motor switch protein FliM
MENSIFTPTEINLLLQRARSSGALSDGATPDRKVEPFNFQGMGQFSEGQVASLSQLHEDFAKQLGRSLSGLLSLGCEATAANVEQISYSDFVSQLPEVTYLGTLRIQTPDGSAVVQADLALVLPVIDLMLGGPGTPVETVRALTEIEQEIFKPIMQMFCRELQTVWATVMETGVLFEQSAPVAANLLPSTEKILAFKFDLQIGELRGQWTLILPSLVSNGLSRKLAQQIAPAEHDTSEQHQRRLKERLLDSRFNLELFLPPSTVSVRDLANLKLGQIVVLKSRSTEPIHFNIAGQNLFQASPVSCGLYRGAQVKRALTIVKRDEKEAR